MTLATDNTPGTPLQSVACCRANHQRTVLHKSIDHFDSGRARTNHIFVENQYSHGRPSWSIWRASVSDLLPGLLVLRPREPAARRLQDAAHTHTQSRASVEGVEASCCLGRRLSPWLQARSLSWSQPLLLGSRTPAPLSFGLLPLPGPPLRASPSCFHPYITPSAASPVCSTFFTLPFSSSAFCFWTLPPWAPFPPCFLMVVLWSAACWGPPPSSWPFTRPLRPLQWRRRWGRLRRRRGPPIPRGPLSLAGPHGG